MGPGSKNLGPHPVVYIAIAYQGSEGTTIPFKDNRR